jgi:hypothetical protein
METNLATIWLLIAAAIVVLITLFVIDINKKEKRSKESLERFLSTLSRSFHLASWSQLELHGGNKRTNKDVAKNINEMLIKDIKPEFDLLFLSLHHFPGKYKKHFTGDIPTHNFIDKISLTIEELYRRYKESNLSLKELNEEFFCNTQEIILAGLQKDSKPIVTKKN